MAVLPDPDASLLAPRWMRRPRTFVRILPVLRYTGLLKSHYCTVYCRPIEVVICELFEWEGLYLSLAIVNKMLSLNHRIPCPKFPPILGEKYIGRSLYHRRH